MSKGVYFLDHLPPVVFDLDVLGLESAEFRRNVIIIYKDYYNRNCLVGLYFKISSCFFVVGNSLAP